jgi:hypothetical protein
VSDLKCDECGEEKQSVTLRENPYLNETYQDNTKQLLCDECIEMWNMEI